jgi:hypothetical protein
MLDAITSPPLAAQQDFWTRELPIILRRPGLNIVDLRNRAAHGRQVSWDETHRLRTVLLGKGDTPGLILRMLQAKQA